MAARRGKAVEAALLVITVASSVVSPARANDDDAKRAAARALAADGVSEIQKRHWAAGIDRLERAEAIVHAPPHLLYIARASVELGKLVKANETYIKILREELPANAPKAFVEARKAAAVEQAALEPRLPKLTIVLNGARATDAGVTMDGSPIPPALVGVAQPTDPGKHVIRVSGEGWSGDETTVTLAERASQTVALKVTRQSAPATDPPSAEEKPPAPRASKVSPLSIAAFGVGVAGIAAGTFFLFKNRSDRGDANSLCHGSACPADKRSKIEELDGKANDAALISWIGYGVGAAGIITGTTLLLLRRGTASPPTKGSITPWVGVAAAGLEGRF
jgi:hypothetical protein